MSADDDMFGISEDDEVVEVEFELLNSTDGKTITLVCYSNKELDPLEYSEAIRDFADRIEALATMTDAQTGTVN